MKEIFEVDDGLFSAMSTVDVWMAFLLFWHALSDKV
ncbi:MAG: hypothetical protein M2R45_04454 [Verrucomicrobia subdivision 3 bacterium]|nr:hypothetical protein [Limisphaerales bacterium]MCS1415015.1 hypothetical protein [Limisphaerales bacterium]